MGKYMGIITIKKVTKADKFQRPGFGEAKPSYLCSHPVFGNAAANNATSIFAYAITQVGETTVAKVHENYKNKLIFYLY